MIEKIISIILNFFKNTNTKKNILIEENNKIYVEEEKQEIDYLKKAIMTNYELNFYNKIKDLEQNYKIIPQLNLASIVKKISKYKYQTELYRNIDFAIFSKDYKEVLLLIELNDKTHKNNNRKDRDLKVKKICNDINIKLITFYTYYPNEKEYVINRIKKYLEEEPKEN